MRLPIYAVWSVDWQDDYLRQQAGLFARISLQIIELTARELNGKVTWFAEIDQRCDITKFPEFPSLAAFPFYKTGEPSTDPAVCDWVEVDEKAGYVDPKSPKRISSDGGLFRIPLGADPRNGDGRHQLHIREAICLETLREVFDYCRRKDPFVSSYFHPYDLSECGNRLTKRMVQQFSEFARYQKGWGAVFLTHLEAKTIFDEQQDPHRRIRRC